MKVLYSSDGFEQDNMPQLCVEGTNLEFSSLIKVLELSIKDAKNGDFYTLPYSSVEDDNKLVFTIRKGDNKLIIRVNENKYQISLDVELWQEVINLLKPLTTTKGYQFVEFNHLQVIEELGLLFRAI